MTDLIQRLRAPRPRPGYDKPLPPHPWMVEAANALERLEMENSEMRRTFGSHPLFEEKDKEIERLRTALKWYASDEQYPVELNRNDEIVEFQRRAREAIAAVTPVPTACATGRLDDK